MAQPTYGWNPFQERIDCHITGEVIKTTGDNRMQYVPRAAPFFGARNFKLYRRGSNAPLTLGVDYIFGNPFRKFVFKYNRNVYGSIILLKKIEVELLADYDTIGDSFVLDAVAYATLVANIINSPRVADWSALVDVPTEFPADPHDHPLAQTYDWLECMQYLESLVLAVTETGSDQMSVKKLLEEHMAEPLVRAHQASGADIGFDLVENNRTATIEDLAGNSNKANITVETLKEALRMLQAGTLNLD